MEPLVIIFSVVSFVVGSVVGSFLNVCVYRVPRHESVVKPRSRCPSCGNLIAWYDNIPLISWLVLGAKCRNCGTTISWLYPLVEALTGALFLLVFWRFGFVLATPVYMALTAGLVLVTFVDLTDWTIPDQVTLPGIPIAVLLAVVATWYPASGLRVLGPTMPVFDAIIGIELGGLLFLLDKLARALVKKRGMGMGDVKLLALLGGFFGWPGVILTLLIASVIGSVVGVVAVLLAQKAKKEEAGQEEDEAVPVGSFLEFGLPGTILIGSIVGAFSLLRERHAPVEEPEPDEEQEFTLQAHYLPFGPYLCLAGLIVMFFGNEILNAWVNYLTSPLPPQ